MAFAQHDVCWWISRRHWWLIVSDVNTFKFVTALRAVDFICCKLRCRTVTAAHPDTSVCDVVPSLLHIQTPASAMSYRHCCTSRRQRLRCRTVTAAASAADSRYFNLLIISRSCLSRELGLVCLTVPRWARGSLVPRWARGSLVPQIGHLAPPHRETYWSRIRR